MVVRHNTGQMILATPLFMSASRVITHNADVHISAERLCALSVCKPSENTHEGIALGSWDLQVLREFSCAGRLDVKARD